MIDVYRKYVHRKDLMVMFNCRSDNMLSSCTHTEGIAGLGYGCLAKFNSHFASAIFYLIDIELSILINSSSVNNRSLISPIVLM